MSGWTSRERKREIAEKKEEEEKAEKEAEERRIMGLDAWMSLEYCHKWIACLYI